MALGVLSFLIALGGAVYLLYRVAVETRQGGDETGTDESLNDSRHPISRENLLKLIIMFALCATLFAANLWPLAFMVLLAAGSISAVEFWKQRAINDMKDCFSRGENQMPTTPKMSKDEALNILGLNANATSEEIKSAHKKLISQLHPDKGGTDYLASKINRARETLL